MDTIFVGFLKVQDEHFSEEIGFILRDPEKEYIQGEHSTTELFDLLMTGKN